MKTRTTTTTAPQQPGRLTTVLERAACGIAWTTQATAAVAYLAAAGQPSTWRPVLDKDPVAALCMGMFVISATAIWLISLSGELAWFYSRVDQRAFRRVGLACHLGVVLICALAVSGSPNRAAWWAALGILSFSAVTTWTAWMETKFLPDEDQAVLDAIIHREAVQRAAVHDASEREKRRVRLTAIVEGLGYTLTDAPAPASEPTDTPAIKWAIPAGKHAPLVYFIRNGNRMKIGTTTELKRRIRALALRAENVTLLIDGDQRRERAFHKQFAEHRIGNTEWFAYEGTLADYVHGQTDRVSREGQGQ